MGMILRYRPLTSKMKRHLIGLAAAAIALLVASFAAVHVIVSTQVLRRWVNTSPDELLLDYESASSWIPGVIRLHGLTMRGSDRNVQWHFRMEDARISYSLLGLLHRQFHATHVRAKGLVFRLRERQEKKELSSAHLSRIPEIPGFSDPPLPLPTPEPPLPSPEEKRRFWTIYVEDLVADPTPEIWIELYRFRGHARVTGGFYLHPHDIARIGPAAVQFVSGDITLGPDELLLRSANGNVTGVFDPYAPDEVNGDEIWPRISGSVKIEGRLEDLRFVNYFLRRSKEPRLSGGSGTTHLSVGFDHGIGRGRAEIEVGGIHAAYGKRALSGKASMRIEIPHWDVEHSDMQVSGSRLDLSDIVTTGPQRGERDWWGHFQISSGRMHNGFDAQAAVFARDARPLYTLFGVDLPGWAKGILELDGFNATARLRLARDLVDISDLDAAGGKFHIAGRYQEKGDLKRGAFLVETGSLVVGVAIDSAGSHLKLIGARKWFRETAAK